GATGAVDKALNGAIRNLITTGDFTGKRKQTAVLYTHGAIRAPRVLIVGLGKQEEFDLEAVRLAAAATTQRIRRLRIRHFATVLHGGGAGGLNPQEASQALVEGTLLASYRFQKHAPTDAEDEEEEDHVPEAMTLVEFDASKLPELEVGVRDGRIIAESACLARNLGNEPANYVTPTAMAQRAQEIAAEAGLTCEVLDEAQMRDLGMGLLLGVAAGSNEPPRFIILEHNSGRNDLPTVVLVGKGITFDSGGINLKPSKEMWRMKDDMAGAAVVIATLRAVGLLNLPLRIVGLAPCTENMPGGRATKPGDVLTGINGKTAEIINTDAEGRLILADALGYAARYNPDAVVDVATLTGAIGIALGNLAAGLFSNDEPLAQRLLAASATSGERLWHMPFWDEYREKIKSDVAQVKNATEDRYAGVATSAKFLEHFTEGYPWAHLDIASVAWEEKGKPLIPKGATGYGVRLLTQFLRDWGQRGKSSGGTRGVPSTFL
ncbi:MAG TPA: leucyl aminopeptidase, partial [Anaerolineae bacterium]|nr:leucyl aminopeptidase [Anaerolineae bacterium]